MSSRAASLLEEFGFEDVWDYRTSKMDWMSRGLPTEGEEGDRMTVGILAMDPALLNLRMSNADAVQLIDQYERQAGVVVAEDGTVLGLLTREEADKARDGTVESAMELGPSTYRPNQDPGEALDYMEQHDLQQIVVADPQGKLIGLLYRDVAEQEVRGES